MADENNQDAQSAGKFDALKDKLAAFLRKIANAVSSSTRGATSKASDTSKKMQEKLNVTGMKAAAKEKVSHIKSTPSGQKISQKLSGVKRSYLWAGFITLALILWLGSGMLFSKKEVAAVDPGEDTSNFTKVKVEKFIAKPRKITVIASGRTEGLRRIEIRARTSGIILNTPRREGETVNKGDLLCELDMGVRTAQQAEAVANLAEAKLNHDAAVELIKEGFVSKTRLATVKAKLDAAKASLDQIEKDIEYTRITAPEKAVIATRPAEVGSFLQLGGQCTTLTIQNPILVVVNLSEKEVAGVKKDLKGSAKLATGRTIQGSVRFVAPTADPNTRTFRVELEVDNSDSSIRDGVGAELTIPVEEKLAHLFSPSILTLNKEGKIGVRVWHPNNTTQFQPVNIIDDGTDGVWVTGLGEEVILVTVGHEYVRDGEKVNAIGLPPTDKQAENTQK